MSRGISRTWSSALLGAFVSVALAACGGPPPTGPGAASKGAAPARATPTPPPSPSAQAIGKDLAARTVLTFNALKSFQGIAQTMEVEPNQGKTNKTEIDVVFKAPDRFRVQVRPGFENAGLKLVFRDGGDHLQIRLAGILGVARLTIGADDPRARNSHGHQIMQVSEKGILNRLADPRGAVTYLGDASLEGKPTHVVRLTGPMLLKGVTEERIHIDKATMVPLRGEMYQGTRLIFASTIKQIKLNTPVQDSVFEI